MHHLRGVGCAQQVVRLSGNPRAGHLLVVGSDDINPFSVYAAKSVDHVGGSELIAFRIVKAV